MSLTRGSYPITWASKSKSYLRKFKLSQPRLIAQILEDLGLDKPSTLSKPTPAQSSKIIRRDVDGKPFNKRWEYLSVIGQLNFLEKSTRFDIGYATHQCARFRIDPKKSHAVAVKRIGRYMKGTSDEGLILDPKYYSFEVFVDANHSGNWRFSKSTGNEAMAKSRIGYITGYYDGCPPKCMVLQIVNRDRLIAYRS